MTEQSPEIQPNESQEPEQGTEQNVEKTLSQADVDRIVKERLARERQKYADYDDLKAKAEAADSSKTDLEKLTEQLQALQQENETNKVKALRSEVASTKGVPAGLLTATTQEELEAQADALLEFAKSSAPKPDPKDTRPKEALRSGAANNERTESAADIAKSVMRQQRGY
jgi:hypothetical protein